jgi:hypothetical protein
MVVDESEVVLKRGVCTCGCEVGYPGGVDVFLVASELAACVTVLRGATVESRETRQAVVM